MKVGYMGIPGSFSEVAAREMIKEMRMQEDITYVPLVCASNILKALQEKEVDCGVLAIENSTAGPVVEFVESFGNVTYEHMETLVMPIHHCLFKKSAEIAVEAVITVASHPQAIAQTVETRRKNWPHMKEQEIEDTAIGAEWLAKGELPETTAVICSRIAGESWGLDLIAENMEDSDTNRTTFWMVQLP